MTFCSAELIDRLIDGCNGENHSVVIVCALNLQVDKDYQQNVPIKEIHKDHNQNRNIFVGPRHSNHD